MAKLTKEIIAKLQEAGLECFLEPGTELPDDVSFEAPCSIKWMQIHYKLSIGAFSYAVKGFYFNVGIGRYTSIGEDVQVGRGDNPTSWVSTSPAFYLSNLFNVGDQFEVASRYHDYVPALPLGSSPTQLKFTEIGHDVYIGHGAFIRPGVKIGNGAIVRAYSVVVKDVPPYAIVAGNPAVIKKYKIPEELIARYLSVAWWRFAPWQMHDINMTNPIEALPALEQLVPTLTPYEPGFRNIKDFVTAAELVPAGRDQLSSFRLKRSTVMGTFMIQGIFHKIQNNSGNGSLTFVTVSFSEEVPSLLLQARSLRVHGTDVVKKWIIIFNDDISPVEFDLLGEMIRTEIKGASFAIELAPRRAVIDLDLSSHSGNRSQQLFKLAIASYIDDPFYVVLDSKNHAIRKLQLNHFIVDGKVRVHQQYYGEGNPFYTWFSTAFRLVGRELPPQHYTGYQSTTPYPLLTDIARACMEPKNITSDRTWAEYILLPGDNPASITEFALYSAILTDKHATDRTVFMPPLYHTMFYETPLQEALDYLNRKEIVFFGLHRAIRHRALTEANRHEIARAWVSFDLFENEIDGIAFLEWAWSDNTSISGYQSQQNIL